MVFIIVFTIVWYLSVFTSTPPVDLFSLHGMSLEEFLEIKIKIWESEILGV
jgi:hypothetical protein